MAAAISGTGDSSFRQTSWPTALTPLSVLAARDQLTCAHAAACQRKCNARTRSQSGACLAEAACVVL